MIWPDQRKRAVDLFQRDGFLLNRGWLNVPFGVYWTSPYSSHLVDHIPNGWVMWKMGTWLMTHVVASDFCSWTQLEFLVAWIYAFDISGYPKTRHVPKRSSTWTFDNLVPPHVAAQVMSTCTRFFDPTTTASTLWSRVTVELRVDGDQDLSQCGTIKTTLW